MSIGRSFRGYGHGYSVRPVPVHHHHNARFAPVAPFPAYGSYGQAYGYPAYNAYAPYSPYAADGGYQAPAAVTEVSPDGDESVEVLPGMWAPMTRYRQPAATMSAGELSAVADAVKTDQPNSELADLGTVIAPDAAGICVHLDLQPGGMLHASILIDGQSYEGSVDLSFVFAKLTESIASRYASRALSQGPVTASALSSVPAGITVEVEAPKVGGRGGGGGGRGYHGHHHHHHHQGQQGQQGQQGGGASFATGPDVSQDPEAVDEVQEATSEATKSAGEMLIGALVAQHAETVSAGWWSSVTHAVSSAAHGIYGAGRTSYNATTGVVAKFKGPITVAATAVATAYGGPAAGAAAAKFTGPLLDAAHDGFNKPQAKKALAEIRQAAATNPAIARAFDVAQRAVAETTAAYHIVDTAGKALDGDKQAITKIADLDKAATGGDGAAQKAMEIIVQALAAAGKSDPEPNPGYTSSDPMPTEEAAVSSGKISFQGGELVGAAGGIRGPQLRVTAQLAVDAANARHGGRWPGIGFVHDGRRPETRLFSSVDEASDWFDDLDYRPRRYRYAAYFGAGDPAVPAVRYDEKWGTAGKPVTAPRMPSTAVATSGEVVGAAIDHLRGDGVEAARAARDDYGMQFIGYVKSDDGSRSNRHGHAVTTEGTGLTTPFATLDEVQGWYGEVTNNPDSYLYAAYFDAGNPAWPNPVEESLGGPAAQAAAHAGAPTHAGALGFLPLLGIAAAGAGAGYLWSRHRGRGGQHRQRHDHTVHAEAAQTAAAAANGDSAAIAKVNEAIATASPPGVPLPPIPPPPPMGGVFLASVRPVPGGIERVDGGVTSYSVDGGKTWHDSIVTAQRRSE